MQVVDIGDDNLCLCSCADRCALHPLKIGSMARCSKKELEASNIKTIRIYDEKSRLAIKDGTCDDDIKLKIRIK